MKIDCPINLNALSKHYGGLGKDEKVLYSAAKEYGIDPKKDFMEITRDVCRSICRA